MLSCGLQQYFGPLTTLISKGCFETEALGYSSKHIFGNQSLRKYINYEGDPFFRMSEFYADSENSIKLPENVDGFEDNCL